MKDVVGEMAGKQQVSSFFFLHTPYRTRERYTARSEFSELYVDSHVQNIAKPPFPPFIVNKIFCFGIWIWIWLEFGIGCARGEIGRVSIATKLLMLMTIERRRFHSPYHTQLALKG